MMTRRARRCITNLRRNRHLTLQVLAMWVLFPVAAWLAAGTLVNRSKIGMPVQMNDARNVLVVTAHPDDESLFFGPTILQLTRKKIQTNLLVLSAGSWRSPLASSIQAIYRKLELISIVTGNHYGLGSVRRTEQQHACSVLGLKRCEVLDVPELQDDPTVFWPPDVVSKIVTVYVSRWNIDTVSSTTSTFAPLLISLA
jgi:N-acetylglucosaminylphosphatidylinositol deacetylase